MSTTTHCDQCGKRISDPCRKITVSNFCTPSGILSAQDFDFCGPDCFWPWTRKWPVPKSKEPLPKIDASQLSVKIVNEGVGLGSRIFLKCLLCNKVISMIDHHLFSISEAQARSQFNLDMALHMDASPQCVLPATH